VGSARRADDHHHHAGHDHSHHDGHTHSVDPDADVRYLTIALVLISGFMIIEVVAGVVAHSLALLSDAAHMLTDAGALAMSLAVVRFVQRPAHGDLTYGRRRAEVLSGQANGALLIVLAGLVAYEAIVRLVHPPGVAARAMTIVAGAGIILNLVVVWVLAKANRQSLNVEGSFQHILTDLYAFIGTFAAGLVILFTGFNRADALASLVVAALMCRSGIALQRKTIRVLLEGAPEDMAPQDVGEAMAHEPTVAEVHDLHLWELAPGHPILTAHVLVAADADCHAVRRALERMLRDRFGIGHTTLQVDHAPQQFLSIKRSRS
jgi:cobalt-zinc-cadmium efflux system protein